MLKSILGMLILILSGTSATSAELTKISIVKMNEIIEQTNFIVNSGCSGTLIDLKNRLILTNYHCIDNNVEIVEREETTTTGAVKKVKFKRYKDVPVVQNGYDGFSKVS